ncbi:MAG TPA: exodeoxyribonuclease VII small subunit [Dermatophilaceae bacterium]|nr:exodeoxyribonuclease VII small subunit [Dermatophilaceae bacterium]
MTDDRPAPTPPDIRELSYEQARDELVSIVSRLEGGQLGLEESMSLWQRGEELAAHCGRWLDGAEAKLAEADAGTPALSQDGPPGP